MIQRKQSSDALLLAEQMCGDAVVLSAAGTLDMVTAPQLRRHTDGILNRRPASLIVDLRRVDFLASAGIAVLMHIQNEADGMAFAVVAEGSATARPLRLLGIDKVIDVHANMAEALRGLGQSIEHVG